MVAPFAAWSEWANCVTTCEGDYKAGTWNRTRVCDEQKIKEDPSKTMFCQDTEVETESCVYNCDAGSEFL